jgi:hypothetical protein
MAVEILGIWPVVSLPRLSWLSLLLPLVENIHELAVLAESLGNSLSERARAVAIKNTDAAA